MARGHPAAPASTTDPLADGFVEPEEVPNSRDRRSRWNHSDRPISADLARARQCSATSAATAVSHHAYVAAPSIAVVWRRIEDHAGEAFEQIRGGRFTYRVESSYLVPDRTAYNLPRTAFEEALTLVPLANTVPVQHLRGPSYLYAILMDGRIRGEDW